MSSLLITICARAGSKGVKGKNIRELNGHPLIYYSIKQALDWGKSKYVVVSTDSKDIAKIAKACGAQVPFLRPAKYATDSAGKVPVIRHALIASEKKFKKKFKMVMDLDITSPIRKIQDLENAYNLFITEKPKTLFSVVPAHRNPYFNMVEENSENRVNVCKPNSGFTSRQAAPKVYDMNASIYIYDRNYLLDKKNNKVTSDDSVALVMNELSRIDIDSELDFKFIEFLIKESLITL